MLLHQFRRTSRKDNCSSVGLVVVGESATHQTSPEGFSVYDLTLASNVCRSFQSALHHPTCVLNAIMVSVAGDNEDNQAPSPFYASNIKRRSTVFMPSLLKSSGASINQFQLDEGENVRRISILTKPEMRSQRLIGNSNPRYQWGQYRKSDEKLKKMKKPL